MFCILLNSDKIGIILIFKIQFFTCFTIVIILSFVKKSGDDHVKFIIVFFVSTFIIKYHKIKKKKKTLSDITKSVHKDTP